MELHGSIAYRKNQQGFLAFGLGVALPLILITAGFCVLAIDLSFRPRHLQHECRVIFLRGQEKAQEQITQLMKLNASARHLRVQENIAKKALRAAIAATNPPAIAAASLALQIIISQRIALGTQQELIIMRGNLALQKSWIEVQSLSSRLKIKSAWGQSRLSLKSTQTATLGVLSDRTPDLAPVYRIDPRIERKQKLAAVWQWQIQVGDKAWKKKYQRDIQCSVSQRIPEDPLKAQQIETYISEAKSPSKGSWSFL